MPLSLNLDLEPMPVPEPTREAVARLVDQYRLHRAQYQQAAYKEAHLREEFVDPFFEALGWDVRNRQGFAPQYREVVVEATIEVEGGKRAPDYCFRLGEKPKFYVEAKAPSVNLREAASPAYQVRRYGWSAGLPLCLLTDFEELAVYDCRRKPSPADKPAVARVGYLTFDQYLDELPFLYSVFSREALPKGFFDRFAEGARGKRGTQTVDAEFLKEIEDWRAQLARNLALRNAALSVRELNFAVQALVDRLLFLRIAEDRKLEPYEQLRHAAASKDVYAALVELFRRADDKYNSGIFDFSRDALSPRLTVDGKILKAIIGRLYYPECPYEFSVLGADILGAVYEQFLGKIIRLTPGHQAKVEEKPEVKKAGGVYYTPTYIVDYIVKHTVGAALEAPPSPLPSGGAELQPAGRAVAVSPSTKGAQRPRERGRGEVKGVPSAVPTDAPTLRILDPACGSGSFLLGAYQYLLDWRLAQCLAAAPAKLARGQNPVLVTDGQGGWRLSTAERKRLLLDHIFGVDLDPQAVEVAKLNLLLKCLEGETDTSLQGQLLRDRALPNIDGNIKCGNSLIGPDYFTGRLGYDDDEYRRVNPFDWQAEFPEIMKSGGFDCVIGNPPYGALLTDEEVTHLSSRFEASTKDLDTYALFMERAVHLVRPGGLVSMIVPTGWYSGSKFTKLRRHMAVVSDPLLFVNLPYDVFAAWVDTTVYVTRRRPEPLVWPRTAPCPVFLRTFPKKHGSISAEEFECDLQLADLADWFADGRDEYLTYADRRKTSLIRKIRAQTVTLGELADVQRGVTPFNLHKQSGIPACRMAFTGTVRRYTFETGDERYIRFDETLAEPKPERYFVGPRLLLRELISRQFRLQAVRVADDFVTNKSMQTILQAADGPALDYLLGNINSRLMSWYFLRCSNVAQRDDFPKIVLKETRGLPIRPIDFTDPADVARHERMVGLVQAMLDLHRRLPAAQTPRDRELLERQIAATDRAIDDLVYELYGLTAEEIALVEGEG